MKTLNQFIVFLSLFMFFTACAEQEVLETNQSQEILETKQSMVNEADASIDMKIDGILHSQISASRSGFVGNEHQYHSSFGGAYIKENGKMVVYITHNDVSYKQYLKNQLGPSNVIFKFCDYSYNDLLNVLDSLNRYLAKTPYDGLNFRHFGLRNIKNRIEVSLIEYNEDRMKDFKQHVHNSPLITFVQGEGVLELHSPLNPGSNIDISQTTADNDGPFGSIGYRAKDANGVTGIVTAGHAFKQNANVLRDGKIIGVANNSYMSGAIDAAFCEIFDSAYTLTNTLYLTGEELSTEILEPTTGGTTINKIGYKTKRTSGKIIDAFDTFDDRPGGGVIYYGVVSATYTSDKGDSGGIVYLYNSGTNKRYTLGIHIGRSGNKAYYSKANAINRHFKIQRY